MSSGPRLELWVLRTERRCCSVDVEVEEVMVEAREEVPRSSLWWEDAREQATRGALRMCPTRVALDALFGSPVARMASHWLPLVLKIAIGEQLRVE